MRSTVYISLILRVGSLPVLLATSATLAACGEVPIAKTNCWSTAAPEVTRSSAMTNLDAGLAARAAQTTPDDAPCR